MWGSYDLGKPRTRILRDGLSQIGVEVIEIHADIWSRHEDKSRLGRGAMLLALLRLVATYPLLLWRYLRAPDHQLVLVPYMGQFDVLVLWLAARLRGRPIVWDMFISLYDTVVHDRGIAAPRSLSARVLWLLEWLGCRAADLMLLDTAAHARHVAGLFGLTSGQVVAVPVGAEPGAFRRLPPPEPHSGPTRLLFYGQMVPLHGISVVLNAALSPRGRRRRWTLIGTGQDRPLVEANWVPAPRYLMRRDLLLRLFGARKPGRVLEFGCGSGALLAELAGKGFTGTGIEQSEAALLHRAVCILGDLVVFAVSSRYRQAAKGPAPAEPSADP